MKRRQIKHSLNPIAISVLLSLPVVSSAANISIKNGTLTTANGVQIVNIDKANENGISHNIYDQLNVGKEGLIFNNSQNGADTMLAGQIAGNSNLTTGTAKVILNEVTSRNKSNLEGMMEVAGDKAHLIIANPNGIACKDCVFINTSKVTVTTGKPDVQDGELKGYSVNGGTVTTNGYFVSDSPTAILARSIAVNGELYAEEAISLVAGNNYVGTDNQVKGTVSASGSRNTYGVDVAALGGMYANKISLVSTESGVGVRNAGTIAGDLSGIQIDTNGRLVNNNAVIKAVGDINVKINGTLDNVTGTIKSEKNIHIDTNKNAINNSRAGNIVSKADVYIDSGAFTNTNGNVRANNLLALNTNGATLTNSGKGNTVGIVAGAVALQTGTLNNSNGQIKGYYIGTQSANINNNSGIIDSYGNVELLSNDSVSNTGGLIRSAYGYVKIDASQGRFTNARTKSVDTISTDSLGVIAGDGGIEIKAASLSNRDGQIASTGNVHLLSSSDMDNLRGKVMTDKNVLINAVSMNNSEGGLNGRGGIDIELTSDFRNRIGVISSEEGDVNLQAQSVDNFGGLIMGQNININAIGDVDNSRALMVAQKQITINTKGNVANQNSGNFRFYSLYLGMPDQEGGMIGNEGVNITANGLNNNSSRIIATNGPLNIDIANGLSSNRSMLVGGTGLSTIKAGSLSFDYSTIYTSGDLFIDAGSLSMSSNGSLIDNNATGMIVADGELGLNINSNFTNYGWLVGNGKVSVNVNGTFNNRNTVSSDNEVNVYGKSAINNYGTIISPIKLTAGSTGRIYNSNTLFSEGTAVIESDTVRNTGNLGGRKGLELSVNSISGNGNVLGL